MRQDDEFEDKASVRIPLAEETVSIERRDVVTGRVRVTTRVETEQHLVEADLSEESVDIVRVPVDAFVDQAPAIRTEGDVTIIPIVEEVAVVEKRLVLREELHLRRRTSQRSVSVPVNLRRQRAEIERGSVTEEPQEKD
jgi:stress response protein YsnF